MFIITRRYNNDYHKPVVVNSYIDAQNYMYTSAANFVLTHKGINKNDVEVLTPALSKLICEMTYEIEDDDGINMILFDNRIKIEDEHEVYFDIEIFDIENTDIMDGEDKKFKVTDNTKCVNGKTVYQIKALKDFSDITKGTYGGYVEKESNLSQDGNCWLYNNSIAMGNSSILGDAKILDDAVIEDNAIVCHNAIVKNNAKIAGNALIGNSTCIKDDAVIYGMVIGQGTVDKNIKIQDTTIMCFKTPHEPEEIRDTPIEKEKLDLWRRYIDDVVVNDLDTTEF